VRDTAALIASGDVAPHPMKKKQQSSHFYANACAYCEYRTLCGMTDSDTERMRLPVTDKEAAAAMQRIMNGEEDADHEQMDTGAGSGD
jgi:ATP-dependent helicase/DNAse subunit B